MFRLLVCTCACAISARASVVLTSGGPVRGKLVQDEGFSYYAYQAIPYAESPTGDLRFKPPVPKQSWSEIRDASEQGPVCPQPEGRLSRDAMSEDCLNINIFVPANTTQKHLPVLVYVHGGGYKANSGNIDIMFGPQLLLKRGIIYVSMNYRLGALGYLSFGTKTEPGNMGLKDLLLALKWIKKNIHEFGGKTITIGGQSSGAAMVHHMLLTEKSTGLFDRAILNSGSATNPRFSSRYPRKDALALAKELGISEDDEDTIMQKLRNANVFDIIDAQENLYRDTRNIMSPTFAPFVPCIEKKSKHSVLTRDPIEIIEAGIPQNVKILTGINSLEGAFLWPTLNSKTTNFLQEQFPLSIPADIEYPKSSDKYKDLVNAISEFYFNDINLSNWTLNNFYDLLSDTQYTYSVGSWIQRHKNRKASEKLYYYLFNFDGDLNWSKITYNISFPGAVHTDEIGYLFVNSATKDKLKDASLKSQQTMENMLTFVTNFIKYGNPTPRGHKWPEHGGAGRHMRLNARPAPAPRAPFAERFAFWDRVYAQYYQYLQNGGVRENYNSSINYQNIISNKC